jgi:hypothetical protein
MMVHPFLAGPADRCRVHTYLVCRTELQMVSRQLQADWTSNFVTERIYGTLSRFRVLKRQVDDSKPSDSSPPPDKIGRCVIVSRKLVAKY